MLLKESPVVALRREELERYAVQLSISVDDEALAGTRSAEGGGQECAKSHAFACRILTLIDRRVDRISRFIDSGSCREINQCGPVATYYQRDRAWLAERKLCEDFVGS